MTWRHAPAALGIGALAASVAIVAGCTLVPATGAARAPSTAVPSPSAAPPSASPSPTAIPTASPPPLPGADAARAPVGPGVPFVGHLLIADRGNGRIVEIDPSGAVTWTFPTKARPIAPLLGPWDDAFYTPDRTGIVANAEDTHVVIAIDIATASIRWVVGTPGIAGKGVGHFDRPDDAVPALDGTIHVADIRNCRIVHLSPSGAFLGAIGSGACVHDPPRSFGSPNGAFPDAAGRLVVTEINGSWVDQLGPSGALEWAVRSPARYPSDALPYPDGSVLLTDYSRPGQVLRIRRDGHVLWRYRPTGPAELDHPSIALPLSADRVAVCDDHGDRVLIVDPRTNETVRTYTSVGGIHLRLPDGLDYRPD